MTVKHTLEVGEEVLAECHIFGMVRLEHGSEEAGNFFGLQGEINGFA